MGRCGWVTLLLLLLGSSLEARNMYPKSATLEDLVSLSDKIRDLKPVLREELLGANRTLGLDPQMDKHSPEIFMCCPRAVNFACDDDYKIRQRSNSHRCGKYAKEIEKTEVEVGSIEEKTMAPATNSSDVQVDALEEIRRNGGQKPLSAQGNTMAAAPSVDDQADILVDDAKAAGRPNSNHYRCQLCVYEDYIVDKFCDRGSEGICFDIKFGCDWYPRPPMQVVEVNGGNTYRPFSHCIEYQNGASGGYYPRP